jgi:hypothetical protein
VAIMGTFKIAMDAFTVTQGWQKCAIPVNNLGMACSKQKISKVSIKRTA